MCLWPWLARVEIDFNFENAGPTILSFAVLSCKNTIKSLLPLTFLVKIYLISFAYYAGVTTWDPFLETLDNFPGPVSIFLSSFVCQLVVIVGGNFAICFTKL